ncbi:MAG: tetratricopeptide repeat protein [Chlorobi bacterium]|nr:tetratricopeptide repeat protein [Chlorobiota bacterium]
MKTFESNINTYKESKKSAFRKIILAFGMTALMIFVLILSSGNLKAANPDSLMLIANNAYNEGNYDSAINVYQRIANQGLESAKLYYNMGNAYFKNGDIPSALLYYEKAKKLDPNNEDIEFNINIANSMIVDKIERVPRLFYQRWWDYFYNMFNANAWAVIAVVSWFILVFFIGIFILSRSRGARKTAFYFGLLFFLISVAVFGLASQKYVNTREHKEAIVFTPTITVKSSPTMNAVDLFVIHEGTKVRILDEVNDWVKIRIPNGSIGWLPAHSVKKI